MREETHPEPICFYCKQPITQQQWPYRTLASGEKAHLACYLDYMDEDENKEKGLTTIRADPQG